jgi:hypothetical protein
MLCRIFKRVENVYIKKKTSKYDRIFHYDSKQAKEKGTKCDENKHKRIRNRNDLE